MTSDCSQHCQPGYACWMSPRTCARHWCVAFPSFVPARSLFVMFDLLHGAIDVREAVSEVGGDLIELGTKSYRTHRAPRVP